jgi:hypothetical protein
MLPLMGQCLVATEFQIEKINCPNTYDAMRLQITQPYNRHNRREFVDSLFTPLEVATLNMERILVGVALCPLCQPAEFSGCSPREGHQQQLV